MGVPPMAGWFFEGKSESKKEIMETPLLNEHPPKDGTEFRSQDQGKVYPGVKTMFFWRLSSHQLDSIAWPFE